MFSKQLIGHTMHPLREFRMVRASQPLDFPEWLQATENHVDGVEVTRNRRLKNVEVLMQWQPDPNVPDESYVVLLSLCEAQTLRRAMQAKSTRLPPIVLFTLNGDDLAVGWCAQCPAEFEPREVPT